VSGSGISWAICKSAPRSRQITVPAPYHSVFTGRMPFLPPNEQCQSTEGLALVTTKIQLPNSSYQIADMQLLMTSVTYWSSQSCSESDCKQLSIHNDAPFQLLQLQLTRKFPALQCQTFLCSWLGWEAMHSLGTIKRHRHWLERLIDACLNCHIRLLMSSVLTLVDIYNTHTHTPV